MCVSLDQIYPHHVNKCLKYTKAYHQIISTHGPLGSDLLKVGWALVCSTNICSCWQCIVLCVIRHYFTSFLYFTKSFDKVTNSKNEKLRLRYALIVRSSIWTKEPHHLAPSFASWHEGSSSRTAMSPLNQAFLPLFLGLQSQSPPQFWLDEMRPQRYKSVAILKTTLSISIIWFSHQ